MFDDQSFFEQALYISLGQETQILSSRLIAAGNINQGVFLKTTEHTLFLKVNFQESPDIFEKEALGLNLLMENSPLKIPEVYHFGRIEDRNFLLMEWIHSDAGKNQYWNELGVGLAEMHMTSRGDFGLDTHNYIASLRQENSNNVVWSDFFIENRLEPLIGKAYYEGLLDLDFLKTFQSIYPKLKDIFPNEKPALLHGDLWSGNVMRGEMGVPVLIDPAVYFGHREMDLAFSQLFGGFDTRFYKAYQEVFPLEPGFEDRVPIYNLYPLLVHLLLFGKSYLSGIERTVKRLL
ncbi:MAG: fructosamine kinase family protein [Cecembia sp.]